MRDLSRRSFIFTIAAVAFCRSATAQNMNSGRRPADCAEGLRSGLIFHRRQAGTRLERIYFCFR